MAQHLPQKAFAIWNLIPRFFVTQASPVLASSGALLCRMNPASDTAEDLSFLNDNWRRIELDYGVPRSNQAELARLSIRFMHAEDTVGANSEAMQVLRKDVGTGWGVCLDYAICAQDLADHQAAPEAEFRVRAYFAEKDFLVGSRGKRYFEECWEEPGVDTIDSVSREIEGSDHDTIALSVEVWEEIFSLVK